MNIKTLLALGLMAGMLFSFADQPRGTKPEGDRPLVEQRSGERGPRMGRERALRGDRERGPRMERERGPRPERGPKPTVLVLKPETTDADVAAFKAAVLKQIDDAVAAGRQNKSGKGRPPVRLAFFVNDGRRGAPEAMGRGPMGRRGDRPRGEEGRGLPPPPPPAE